jgi:hypothetical protein
VIVLWDVTVDERAKGSDLRSEFEVGLKEVPAEKLVLNGEPIWTTQKPSGGNSKREEGRKKRWRSRRGHRDEQRRSGETVCIQERRGLLESGIGQTWRLKGKRRNRKPMERRWRVANAKLWKRAMDDEFASVGPSRCYRRSASISSDRLQAGKRKYYAIHDDGHHVIHIIHDPPQNGKHTRSYRAVNE